ncbi:hypothetical protein NQ317_007602 [Molorchus minor]|uniref:DDE Tnp4 domain-containing protein n=1 Tax=Molorchus minor TaxID=1323400 RepID=A0ABQ9JR46_9CUCU|nr:hypothetical protein NQ317_007602 [Molorchus minor]
MKRAANEKVSQAVRQKHTFFLFKFNPYIFCNVSDLLENVECHKIVEAVIVATAVLHNIVCENPEEVPQLDVELELLILQMKEEACNDRFK